MNAPLKVPPTAPNFSSGSSNQNALLRWMEDNHRTLGATFQSRAYGARVYVITDPRDVEQVLRRNWQNYRRGRSIKRFRMLLGNGLVVNEGELWKRQRRMIHLGFHEKAIEKLTTLIQTENDGLIDRWSAAVQTRQPINVTYDVSVLILTITLKIIFGDDYDKVASPFAIVSEEVERTMQFAHEFRALGQIVRDIAGRRRETNADPDDILGLLLRARDRDTGQGMSDNQIVDEVLTLLVAGHETTASTLNWAWYHISQDAEVADRLHIEAIERDLRESAYTKQVIEEVMRMYPALWLFTRQTVHDDVLGEYFVPAKTEIYICPYLTQRCPDLWPEPGRFDPDRFDPAQAIERHPLALFPFAAGPRNCIGEHLARWEMVIHIRTIASRLRLRYTGSEPEFDVGINLRSKNDFIMEASVT